MTRHSARSHRSPNLEKVLAEVDPPAEVAEIARRMAVPALRRRVDVGENTWKAIVLGLADRLTTGVDGRRSPRTCAP